MSESHEMETTSEGGFSAPMSSKRLEARFVFIDASIFRKAAFTVNGTAFLEFQKLCRQGHLKSITTEVTLREIDAQIQKHCEEACDSLDKFRKRTKCVPNVQKKLASITATSIACKMQRLVRGFIQRSKTKVVPFPTDAIDRVFNRYFARAKPFGEEKKKSEFPDAFALEALLALKKNVYVISTDGDFRDCNDSIYSLHSVDELLDVYNSHYSSVTERIRELVWKNEREIVRWADEEIKQVAVEPANADGRLDDVSCSCGGMQDVLVVSASNNRATVSCELAFTVRGFGYLWDERFERFYYQEFEEEVNFPAEIDFYFDLHKETASIGKATLKAGSSIKVQF